jgi:hypothetical protein
MKKILLATFLRQRRKNVASNIFFMHSAWGNNRFNSFDFAAKPPNQTKKKSSSLLPQAKKPLRLEQPAPTAEVE